MDAKAFKRGENAQPLKGAKGVLHLFKGKRVLEWDGEREARVVADRVGGQAYRNNMSKAWLVRFNVIMA